MENYKVYMHICPNGKAYVGITKTTLRERWGKDGYNYRKQLFGRAIKKYGWDNIEHILIADGMDKEMAEMLEEATILGKELNLRENGYNISVQANGCSGYKHTEEAKRKMSIARSGSNNYGYGQHWSEELKAKMSEARKGLTAGEKNPSAKLTVEQVKEIKRSYKFRDKEFGAKPLSKKYGVAPSTISAITTGRLWGDVDG